MKLLGVIVLLVATSGVVLAQDAKSLEQIKSEELFQSTMESFKRLEVSLNAFVRSRETDCSKAIGYAPFCKCVLKDLPVAWSFADYVAITTRSKEQNGYDKMDAVHKQAYEKVAPIRDRCVRLINGAEK